ncbi:ABC transporter permease [Gordonia sp. KTR9]|uniref:ABC transporter permease n=1 Tax=Gordonia sp. KTR9 TaxID=337191 RepID=UPI00027DDF8B|nr:ABC transporter permease [Gordonia sp. KTR9]AFR50091.1 ABC-type nitrate/sulfonate/bicarbonate transport system, permease component [Gordonia sp. KTR9]
MADPTLSISAPGDPRAVEPGSTDASSASAKSGRSSRLHTILRALSPIAVLVLWQVGSALGVIPQDKLPAPSLIAEAGWEVLANGQLVDAIAASAQRVAIGLTIGVAVGIGLGLLVGLSRIADSAIDPNMQAIRALPLFGLIPLFILWFGIGETPKVLLVSLGALFPLYLNTSAAIRQIDGRLVETARVLGFSRLTTIRDLIIPGAMPQILVGLRQALAIAWLSLIVAEQIAATSGLGYLINNARDFLRTDIIFFGLIVYAAVGLITDAIVRALERYTTRYQNR